MILEEQLKFCRAVLREDGKLPWTRHAPTAEVFQSTKTGVRIPAPGLPML